MKLDLRSEQKLLLESVSKSLKVLRDPARLRDAEREGFDHRSWKSFCELGLPLLRVDESMGGSKLGLLEAVLVSAAAAESLALIPVADTFAVTSLLSGLAVPEAEAILKDAEAGKIVLLGLADAEYEREQLILFGHVADVIVYRHGMGLYARSGPGSLSTGLGRSASSTIQFQPDLDVRLAHGEPAIRCWQAAVEEWKLYNAASIASMARQSLVEACDYARERTAFDRHIGSFQGLAHPLADSLADVDCAELLIWRAVEKVARGANDAAGAISQAVWWAQHRCGLAAQRAMRVFGGYGMTLEYDAQIFFKRISAQSLALGDPSLELERAGRRLFLAEKAAVPDAETVDITFEFDPLADEVASIIREVFRAHVTPDRETWAFETDDGYDPELFKALAARNVLYPDWPREHGGMAANGEAAVAAEHVFNEFDWNYTIVTVTSLFGKILMRFGSDQAKQQILPGFADGTAFGTLCYSEPSSGSDIFAVRTRARRDGENWIIDGQKMFTSQGHMADYGLMLARTGEGPKHQTITLFAVPLRDPGYRCEPIETIGGERTNVTFYDGMVVPDTYRIGEVNGGTKVLAAALMMEQGASELYVGKLGQLVSNLLAWADQEGRLAENADGRRGLVQRLARIATYRDATDVLSRRAVAANLAGTGAKHFGPMGKLFGSEAWVECSRSALETVGPRGMLAGQTPLGRIEKSFRQSVPGTIYAGTSEIQRSLVAEAGLNLPRSRS